MGIVSSRNTPPSIDGFSKTPAIIFHVCAHANRRFAKKDAFKTGCGAIFFSKTAINLCREAFFV
jgi:hypothetical protein